MRNNAEGGWRGGGGGGGVPKPKVVSEVGWLSVYRLNKKVYVTGGSGKATLLVLTEIEVADQTYCLIQSQYTDSGPTSPSTFPLAQVSVRDASRVPVFVSASSIWIYVLSRVRQAGRPPVLRGKTFNIGHYTQTFQLKFFIPAMLIDSIDFYNLIPLSMTLTVPGGHKVSAKQDLFASFSPTIFS